MVYSYALLVCPHSPCWPTSLTGSSSAVILHAGLLLLRITRLTLFLLTYIRTFGRNTVLGIGGLHLICVARLSSFAALAYSYLLLICPHSLCWPTSRTSCSSALILHARLLLLRIARLTSFLLTYIRMSGRNAVFGIGGLHLVRVARLSSFCLLAYLSYTFRVCSHSPLPTACTRCSSALILLVGQHLVPVACRPSFSTLAYCSYAFLVCSHSPLPTARMRCSSALILLAGLYLVRVAHLPLFSSLVYILYALLVCPYAPPYVHCRSRLDLRCWTLYYNVYIYFK